MNKEEIQMRNLKRALSMALAAVMVLGLMVVGASAAGYDSFTDKDEIVHKEAVSMITELGVLAGLPDGSFGATQNIDRASFARLVCVVLNGGQEPVLGNLTTSFKDTQGNWAEKYIAFCVDRGIIAGRGNNTFGPSDNVTGSEAAKMLLVALGYNAAYEGIGGSTWEITTNSLANMAGLYKGLETINPSQPLTRDNAAQMIYNVLNAQTVTYSFTYNANGTTTAVQNKTGKTMLEDKFNAIKVEGVVVANEYANLESTADKGAALDAGKTRIDVTNYGTNEDQKVFNDGTFAVSTGADVLGKSVVLYVKNDSSNTSKATVLGNAIISDSNVVVAKANNHKLAKIADDSDLKIASSTPVLTNYTNAVEYGKYSETATRGVEKTLIDNNDDGTVDYIFMTTYYFGQVSKYSTKDDGSITVNVNKAWNKDNLIADDKDDVVGFEDVAANDYVLAAWIGGKLHVEKAEAVTGTLQSYKTSDSKNSQLTVDGTTYDVSEVAGYVGGDNDITVPSTYADIKNALDTEATFYLDKNGMIVAMGNVSENASNYAYVWAYEPSNGIDNGRVKVTLSDGTTKTYDVASKSDLSKAITDSLKGEDSTQVQRIYAYSINSDGQIKLTDPTATVDKNNKVDFNKGKTTLTGLDQVANASANDASRKTGVYAASNTSFFYVSLTKENKIDSVSVYTGYQSAPSVTKATTEAAFNSGNKMVAVAFEAASLATSSVADHLYVTSIVSIGSKTTTVKAVLAGTDTETEIKVDGTWSDKGLFLYSVDSDGVYTLSSASGKVDTTAVKNISGSTVVTNTKEYKLFDKTVWVELDKDGGFETATLNKLPSDSDKGLVTTILANSDDQILVIVTKAENTVKPPVVTEGITVNVNGSNKITVSWTGTNKPSNTAIVQAIRVKLAEVNGISDYTKVTGKTADSVKYTFTVDVNGMETTYPEFNMSSDVSQEKATTTAPTVTVAQSAEKGATVTKVIGAGETGSITGYVDSTSDCVDITVSDAPSNVTYKTEITGATKTNGNTYDLTGAGTNLVITVTASRTGYDSVVYTYTYTVAA
ncbi:hypothetical protein B5G43_09875 [Flavonifractor sp. An92]|nr:hypothetical protein B5G43_09875 [Flavonifractor sp. An92]